MPAPPALPRPDSRLGRLAATACDRRRAVLVAWLVALVAAVAAMLAAGGEHSADYATPGSDSEAASERLAAEFGGRSGDSVDLVFRQADGAVSDPEVGERVTAVLERAGGLEGIGQVPPLGAAQVSPDGRTASLSVPLDRPEDDVPSSTGVALAEAATQASTGGLVVAVGGGDVGQGTEGSAISAEVIGVLVAMAVLLLALGAVVAAGLPLLTALLGVGLAVALGGLMTAALDTPDWALQVSIMIGLGVGIDYALLIITRHKAGLAAGLTPRQAAVRAMETAGRSVLVAGATVVVSMLGLFLMGLPYLYGVALAACVSVLAVLAANLTLLPAMLGFAGRRVDALPVPGVSRTPADPDHSRAARWARGVQRRPVAATGLALVLLVAMALPLTGIRFGFPDAGNDSRESTTRVAYDLSAEAFGPGANGPLIAVAATPDAAARTAVDRLAGRLRSVPGVAAVSAPQPNPAGTTSLVTITPTTSPQDERTQRLIERLRGGVLADAGVQVDLGGQTASTVDQADATAARLPLFIGGVIGLSFLLLLAAFRSPVVAVKAGVLNVLTIAAAYGVVSLVAEGGWAGRLVGIDADLPIPPFIPVMMFAVLFGLSMDYEVFLMSRVKEELARGGDARAAVVAGVARTAKVITAAAAIMVAVFAAFALSPEVFLKLIGIGLATAIFIDATIVRMLLVPAVMELLGDRAWWTPRWLDRLLPQVDLEGPAEDEVALDARPAAPQPALA